MTLREFLEGFGLESFDGIPAEQLEYDVGIQVPAELDDSVFEPELIEFDHADGKVYVRATN